MPADPLAEAARALHSAVVTTPDLPRHIRIIARALESEIAAHDAARSREGVTLRVYADDVLIYSGPIPKEITVPRGKEIRAEGEYRGQVVSVNCGTTPAAPPEVRTSNQGGTEG